MSQAAGPGHGDEREHAQLRCLQCTECEKGAWAGDFTRFDCARCGPFALSLTAEAVLERRLAEEPSRRSLMSHTLRRIQRPDQKHLHIIQAEVLPTFWSESGLPSR